jgi:uncharacterized membrane protein YciS (DUF1049 family)
LAEALRIRGHQVTFEFGALGEPAVARALIEMRGFQMRVEERPDIMLVADPRCYPGYGCPVVDLGHGLGCKDGYYYDDVEYASDYLFVSSEWIAGRMRKRDKTKIMVTGMPKHDRAQGVALWPRMVLIAPTCNLEYNALLMVYEQIHSLIQEGYKVVIKPHVYSSRSNLDLFVRVQAMLLEAVSLGAEVRYDYNVTTLLAQAEYVVSDVSSVYMEALGLGKKVVLCESAFMREEKDRKLQRGAHEYYFQQDCVLIKRGEDLIEALALVRPTYPDRQRMLISNSGQAIPVVIQKLEEIYGQA